jgi:hypothetical protein
LRQKGVLPAAWRASESHFQPQGARRQEKKRETRASVALAQQRGAAAQKRGDKKKSAIMEGEARGPMTARQASARPRSAMEAIEMAMSLKEKQRMADLIVALSPSVPGARKTPQNDAALKTKLLALEPEELKAQLELLERLDAGRAPARADPRQEQELARLASERKEILDRMKKTLDRMGRQEKSKAGSE